jgi:hypothetical protein
MRRKEDIKGYRCLILRDGGDGRKERRKEGRKVEEDIKGYRCLILRDGERRKDGRTDGQKEGRKEGRKVGQ